MVTLSPSSAEHSEFKGWSGACTGTGSCEVTMSQARAVSAEFVTKPKLTVSDTGPGEGTVTSSPPGINCGTTCAAQYNSGTKVTLTATPAEHSEFKGWSGACTGAGTCEVTMSEAKSVSAEFAPKPRFKLTVSDTGPGEGTVTSSPGGIACGASCEAEYERSTVVTLVPVAAEHSEFKGWSGACTGTGTCEVTMSEAKSVGAEFVQVATPRFKLSVSETGSGLVTSIPDGIACGAICERGYEEGTVVTLIPVPGRASEFKGWSGACTGTGTCEVTMSEAREVTANFGNVLTVPPVEPVGGGGPSPGSSPTGEELPHHHHKSKTSSLAKCKKLKGKKKAEVHKARPQARSLVVAAAIAVGGALAPPPAQALITPPVTVDGPSSEILDFGGVAMASDGTGGLVYTKAVEGVPHVFASRYVNGSWSAPVRGRLGPALRSGPAADRGGPRRRTARRLGDRGRDRPRPDPAWSLFGEGRRRCDRLWPLAAGRP